jgi:hypothetical protein
MKLRRSACRFVFADRTRHWDRASGDYQLVWARSPCQGSEGPTAAVAPGPQIGPLIDAILNAMGYLIGRA